MKICGYNKTTLLDYPGRVASTIFLGGCNFICPFCQNGDLVLNPAEIPAITEQEVFSHLKKRQGIIEGVCITGGEPTLNPKLRDFIKRIKELGLLVKLDTNGSRPEILKTLIDEGLIDMVAMDIKADRENYPKVSGIKNTDINAIDQSTKLLINGDIPYEFRTTVVHELFSKEQARNIAGWLKGAKQYFLQSYKDSERVIKPGFSAPTLAELNEYKDILSETIEQVDLRGADT